MNIGDTALTTRTFTNEDIEAYAILANAAPPPGIVPEPLIAGLFSYLLGVRLPGPGANYLKQETRFIGTAKIGAPVTARVTVTRLRPEKFLVDLETVCSCAADAIIAQGRALLFARDVDGAFGGNAPD